MSCHAAAFIASKLSNENRLENRARLASQVPNKNDSAQTALCNPIFTETAIKPDNSVKTPLKVIRATEQTFYQRTKKTAQQKDYKIVHVL